MPKNIDKRLNKNEALLYQDYATNLEGKKFSEKAEASSYEEAEMLLDKLKNKNFDWLKIDWGKFDLKNIDQYQELEERLDEAAKMVVGKEKSAIGKAMARLEGMVLPIAVSIGILLASPNFVESKTKEVSKDTKKIEEVENAENVISMRGDISINKKRVENWKAEMESEGIEFRSIIIEGGVKMEKSKTPLYNTEHSDWVGRVTAIITLKDGTVYKLNGEGRPNDSTLGDPILEGVHVLSNYVDKASKKMFGKEFRLPEISNLRERTALYRALNKALNSFEPKSNFQREFARSQSDQKDIREKRGGGMRGDTD
jgi:hypothetical protein